jgi:hypothetical protein
MMQDFINQSGVLAALKPEGEGSNTFSEFLGDLSPKNSELKDFSPFPSRSTL